MNAQRAALGEPEWPGPVTAEALGAASVHAVLAALDAGVTPEREALRWAVTDLLGLLAAQAPGRAVEVRIPPSAAASAHAICPAASLTQVTGSVSTTFGGVPRVCRGPATHWIAAYGGMRTSTARPGAWAASTPSRSVTAQRSASRSGVAPASRAASTARTQAAPSASAVTGPGHSGSPSAARCAFTAASNRAGSARRTGTLVNLAPATDDRPGR